MAQIIADRRDIDFVLYEQLNIEQLSKHERFAEFNKKTVDMVITEARNLAIKEILPTRKIGDDEGCRFEGGKVTVPESFHKVYELFREGEWVAMTEAAEWGGQGMPVSVALAAGRELCFCDVSGTDSRRGKIGGNLWNREAEKALSQENVHRRMGRNHAAYRTAGRFGCGRAYYGCSEKR